MDQTKIWDYFQNNDDIGDTFTGARTRYEYLAKQVVSGMHVLNIGVGRGGLEAILSRNGIQLSCLDPSEVSINKIRELFEIGDRAQIGFSQAIPFEDGEFDVVIMSEVLEHLNDEVILSTFKEVSRVLKNGGRFIGTVPADERLLDNQVICPHCGVLFHRWGHVQRFTQHRLLELLSVDFIKVNISRHFFANFKTLNWKGKIVSFSKLAFLWMGSKGSNETFFFSVNKE